MLQFGDQLKAFPWTQTVFASMRARNPTVSCQQQFYESCKHREDKCSTGSLAYLGEDPNAHLVGLLVKLTIL